MSVLLLLLSAASLSLPTGFDAKFNCQFFEESGKDFSYGFALKLYYDAEGDESMSLSNVADSSGKLGAATNAAGYRDVDGKYHVLISELQKSEKLPADRPTIWIRVEASSSKIPGPASVQRVILDRKQFEYSNVRTVSTDGVGYCYVTETQPRDAAK